MKRVSAISCFSFLSIFAFAPLCLAADLGTEQQKTRGKELYDNHCVQCHGDKGDGLGPAAAYYRPAPRDFTQGKYKVRTTGTGELPTDQDIANAIKKGLAFKPGMAYTVMPPWPNLSDEDVMSLVYYLKTFSADFSDAEYNNPKVVSIPSYPGFSEESAKKGREVFAANECIKCHGENGRGDGNSAPTLKDDWDFHIRAADLTKRWTYRGGGAAEDIFRTVTTGFNGTPMPAYGDVLSEEQRWDLVNYIVSLSDRGEDPNYNKADNPVRVAATTAALHFADIESAEKAFETSPVNYIPLSGQVIEPGRGLHPAASEVEVRGVYNNEEVALLLRWNDLVANTSGENSPSAEVPTFEPPAQAADEDDEDADPFGDLEAEEEEDPFGEDEEDPFAEDEAGEEGGKWSDAVAVQFPSTMPEGFEKPYFVFGDKKNAAELWFRDLAKDSAQILTAKGSDAITATDAKLDTVSEYKDGTWTVVLKRKREVEDGLSLEPEKFIPIAFSVWDGFFEERGNKRALSSWFSLYLEPLEKKSALLPVLLWGGGAFLIELLIVWMVRRKARS